MPCTRLSRPPRRTPSSPYAYLRYVFTEMPKAPDLGDVEALLPTRLDTSPLANASTSLETS